MRVMGRISRVRHVGRRVAAVAIRDRVHEITALVRREWRFLCFRLSGTVAISQPRRMLRRLHDGRRRRELAKIPAEDPTRTTATDAATLPDKVIANALRNWKKGGHDSLLPRTSGTPSIGCAGTRDAADPLMAHELPKRHVPWTIHDPPPEPPVPINDPDPADIPDEHPSEDGTESSSEAPIPAGINCAFRARSLQKNLP